MNTNEEGKPTIDYLKRLTVNIGDHLLEQNTPRILSKFDKENTKDFGLYGKQTTIIGESEVLNKLKKTSELTR